MYFVRAILKRSIIYNLQVINGYNLHAHLQISSGYSKFYVRGFSVIRSDTRLQIIQLLQPTLLHSVIWGNIESQNQTTVWIRDPPIQSVPVVSAFSVRIGISRVNFLQQIPILMVFWIVQTKKSIAFKTQCMFSTLKSFSCMSFKKSSIIYKF